MVRPSARVQKFSSDTLTSWMRDAEQNVAFGDIVGEETGARMDVTFIKWGKGESHEFAPLPYDEVFIVLKGSYTVRTADAELTANPGEVLYLWTGMTGTYSADEDAEIVAVTYPPYRQALRESGRGDDLDALREEAS